MRLSSWVLTNVGNIGPCYIYKNEFFNKLDYIHSYCRECYKLVARPKTVMDLLAILNLQFEMNVPSKCGIELRMSVHGNYGGYWYCRGLEEGRERWQEVRELVPNHIKVILKRYCTEFELGRGPSNKTPDATEKELEFERGVMEELEVEERQITDLKNRIPIVEGWIRQAHSRGDETYLEANHGEELYPACVTYHKK